MTVPELTYHLVDVFTDQQFGGNQLAVFPDGQGLAPELMQKIARELNLSETTFIMPPTDDSADFRVRIFTPQVELPLAGHPTVGTAYILRREEMIEPVGVTRLEEGVGVINVSLEADQSVVMHQPIPHLGGIFEDRGTAADLLSLSPADLDERYPAQAVGAGVPFLFIPVKTLDAMGRIRFRLDVWERAFKDFEAPHIFTFSTETESPDSTVHSRAFVPAVGIFEDPATGAASGPLGVYLVKHGIVEDGTHILSEQGIEMGRPSYINISVTQTDGEISGVSIGGTCVYVGQGVLHVQ
jgi:trans-2,3-dihydro-3-hydroxyanthranilate isomerase